METDTKIPLSDERKRKLIEAIHFGLSEDIIQFKNAYKLTTYNSLPMMKWDFTFTNFNTMVVDDSLQPVPAKRGSWEFELLFDEATGYLYSFMQENRFNEIVERRRNRTKVHYLDALASLNEGFEGNMKGTITQQASLSIDMGIDWTQQVNSVLDKIIHILLGRVQRFVVVCFSSLRGEITSFTAYIPSPDLVVTHREDWNEFIPSDFGVNTFEAEIDVENSDEEIVIRLRSDVLAGEQDAKLVQLDEHRDKVESDDITRLRTDIKDNHEVE